jgi:transcriptional regulator with XRE-family HTH domain
MPNDRLREALALAQYTQHDLAEVVGVDPKTVERWVRQNRVPHRKIAERAAQALHEDVQALWPALRSTRRARAVHPELVALYPRRADAPANLWWDMFSGATTNLDVLLYAAVFLHEQHPELNALLAHKAAQGCQVRIAIGDPDSDNVAARGAEEKFGHGIESRCRLAVMHYTPLASVEGCQVRMHGTTLYNSIYRVDDHMLVNAHLWGMNAYGAPLWHLRRVPDAAPGMFDTYLASFDEVWSIATTVED